VPPHDAEQLSRTAPDWMSIYPLIVTTGPGLMPFSSASAPDRLNILLVISLRS